QVAAHAARGVLVLLRLRGQARDRDVGGLLRARGQRRGGCGDAGQREQDWRGETPRMTEKLHGHTAIRVAGHYSTAPPVTESQLNLRKVRPGTGLMLPWAAI